MTLSSDPLLELAGRLERMANNALLSADAIWGWRERDKKVSRAFGALSRDLRETAQALRNQEQSR